MWYAAPSIIIIFYFLNILGQFISSSTRKKEEYSKKHVLLWGIVERLGFILIFLSLKFFLDSQIILPLFFITYAIFVYSAGAILPAYFDLVSRVLYKLRAIFFAANLTMGSLAGFLVSRYVDIQIQSEGLVEGFLDGLLIVIIVTSISLIPLGLIKEPKDVNQLKTRLSIKNIYNKSDDDLNKLSKNIDKYLIPKQLEKKQNGEYTQGFGLVPKGKVTVYVSSDEIIKFINNNNLPVKVNVKLNKEVPGMRYIKN